MIEATNDLNLSEIHECFANTFANVQPANRLKLGDVALIGAWNPTTTSMSTAFGRSSSTSTPTR